MKNPNQFILSLMILFVTISCDGFLEEKPEKSILVPSTTKDIRALLDYYTTLNANALISFVLADDWVTTSGNWETLSPWQQNAYLWQEEVFNPDERSTDYVLLHKKIFYANVSMAALKDMPAEGEAGELVGEALFLRAMAMYQLGQLFLPHPAVTASGDIRIPVKFTADMDDPGKWLDISELLDIVEKDLEVAYGLLPENAAHPNRPEKITAKALLSSVYLYRGSYGQALEAANEVLESNQNLMDYGKLDSGDPYPFRLFNEETLYYGVTSSFAVTASSATYINPGLFSLYGDNDLRKNLFFTLDAKGMPLFKGSYLGDYNLFSGVSLSEVQLNGAESAFRLGDTQKGASLLKALATMRYSDLDLWLEEQGGLDLESVMNERRKELVFRGTRWADMKRLAAKGELTLPLEREIGGTSYLLQDMRQFTLALPDLELDLEEK